LSDIDYSELDPGIRDVVRLLRSWGFNTTDSGDGVSKPEDYEGVLRVPHVHCTLTGKQGLKEQARRMHRNLRHLAGVSEDDFSVEACFLPASETAVISLFHLNDEALARAQASNQETPTP
jgi:hypothetical protein